MLSAPTRIAPASLSLRRMKASAAAGGRSASIFDPARVTRPSMSNRFLTANGAPASGPSASPPRAAAVDRARLGQRALGGDRGEGVERGVARRDMRERRLGDLDRARGAGADRRRRARARRASRAQAHGVKTGAGSVSSGSGNSMTSAAICGDALEVQHDAGAMRRVERQPDQRRRGIDIGFGVERFGQTCLTRRNPPCHAAVWPGSKPAPLPRRSGVSSMH